MTRTLDLPLPPSVNRIWRYNRQKGRVYLDPKYAAWKREADGVFMQQKRRFGPPIAGHFTARIVLDAGRRGTSDCDNRGKVVLDALQRFGVIANDRFADLSSTEWGEAPMGCRVFLTEVAA